MERLPNPVSMGENQLSNPFNTNPLAVYREQEVTTPCSCSSEVDILKAQLIETQK